MKMMKIEVSETDMRTLGDLVTIVCQKPITDMEGNVVDISETLWCNAYNWRRGESNVKQSSDIIISLEEPKQRTYTRKNKKYWNRVAKKKKKNERKKPLAF